MGERSATPLAKRRPATGEGPLTRTLLLIVALSFLGLFIFLPLLVVFSEALAGGVAAYLSTFDDPDVQAAIRLTLLVAAIAVPFNLVFGLVASWTITKFDFPGKTLLVTLIDLPFSVSPVVSGLVFVLVFGANGLLGPWLQANHLQIIF